MRYINYLFKSSPKPCELGILLISLEMRQLKHISIYITNNRLNKNLKTGLPTLRSTSFHIQNILTFNIPTYQQPNRKMGKGKESMVHKKKVLKFFRCPIIFIIREMQIKTSPIKIKLKNTWYDTVGEGSGHGLAHTLLGRVRLMQPFCRTLWQFLSKINLL